MATDTSISDEEKSSFVLVGPPAPDSHSVSVQSSADYSAVGDSAVGDSVAGDSVAGDSAVGDSVPDNGVAEDSHGKGDLPSEPPSQPAAPDYTIIGDIPVLLTLEVGNKEMTISELSQLQPGSTVCLMHKENEPLDVKVNGVLIGCGEVVLSGDNYGVRILSLAPGAGAEFLKS